MPLFALNETASLLAESLASKVGRDRLESLVKAAWYFRQRDSEQAMLWCSEAETLMDSLALSPADQAPFMARIELVRGEAHQLFARSDEASACANFALRIFKQTANPLGEGDAYWLLGSVWAERGNNDEMDAAFAHMQAAYRKGGDVQRIQAADARVMVYLAFRDPVATGKKLLEEFPLDAQLSPDVALWVETARANVAGLTDDVGDSIKHDLAAFQAAQDSGQIRQASINVLNATESFAMLGDLDSALEWGTQGLGIARAKRWPAVMGVALMQVGDILRLLGRHQESLDHLQEALQLMEVASGSRNYDQILYNLGLLALDMGDLPAALEWFNQFEHQGRAHGEPDLEIRAWRGQAAALLRLGRVADAIQKIDASLALARQQGNADGQIQALSVLATIHAEHDLPTPPDMTAPSAPLHYLNLAKSIADGMEGYALSPDLLLQIAAAHAEVEAYKAAYFYSQEAVKARLLKRNEEARSRAVAMQIRQEVAKANSEAERHREMAAALQETAATLETLGTIGREITASLNADAVFKALDRHVNELLDATVFAIYLIDEEHKFLVPAFAMEAGKPMSARPVAVANPTAQSAKSARRRQEIIVNLSPEAENVNLIPGTLPTISLLYFPLVVGERLLGVMSIQSPRVNAYGEREQSIFRALCAYGAIALDNAAAYSAAGDAQRRADAALAELRHTQTQLLEQNLQLERLAVTDQLTGLFNRLRLDHTLEEEHSRNMRYGTHFCVLLLDVDQFKAVNDTYGHQTGDEVLVGIARTLQDGIREVDMAGRWGGEEFLIICRETALEGALILAEKLRIAVHARTYEKVGKMSASFGVAMFRPGEVLTETIARADAALYRAKQAGRNRVENGEA